MARKPAEIIFTDSPTKHNHDLTEFLKRNLEKIIIKGRVQFKFRIARSGDFASLRKRGINRLPAMILDNRNYIGVPQIEDELIKRVKNSKASAMKKTEDEFLDDYFKSTLTRGVERGEDGKFTLPDEREDDQPDLGALAMREAQRRDPGTLKPGQRAPPPRNPDRTAVQDDDYEDYVTRGQPRRPAPRADNLDTPAGDPMATIDRLAARGQGDGDDDLLKQLMEKMGDD